MKLIWCDCTNAEQWARDITKNQQRLRTPLDDLSVLLNVGGQLSAGPDRMIESYERGKRLLGSYFANVIPLFHAFFETDYKFTPESWFDKKRWDLVALTASELLSRQTGEAYIAINFEPEGQSDEGRYPAHERDTMELLHDVMLPLRLKLGTGRTLICLPSEYYDSTFTRHTHFDVLMDLGVRLAAVDEQTYSGPTHPAWMGHAWKRDGYWLSNSQVSYVPGFYGAGLTVPHFARTLPHFTNWFLFLHSSLDDQRNFWGDWHPPRYTNE